MHRWWIGWLLLAAASLCAEEAEKPPAEEAKKPPAKPKRLTAPEWVTLANCKPLRDAVMRDIEELTRIRFRRPVPVRIQPRAEWEANSKAGGFIGHISGRAPAFYTPGNNRITFVPWVMDGRETPDGWRDLLRVIMHHELAHALHHQNFWTESGNFAASLKVTGLTEEEIDASTVDFLAAEGFADLVAYSLSLKRFQRERAEALADAETIDDLRGLRHSRPERKPHKLAEYMKRYRPPGKKSYRAHLSEHGYRDGLTCMYHLMLRGGMRAVRSVLYRPPPRLLLFSPDLLAGIEVDDPPEPDAIFRFLHPGELDPAGLLLATNPGQGRFFKAAARGHAVGCLLGYVARARDGSAEYAFFLADPSAPGVWAERQLRSLRGLSGRHKPKHRRTKLPLARNERVDLTRVPVATGTYVHARLGHLVVLVFEKEPTKGIEERVLLAMRALVVKRPSQSPFAAAVVEAKARLSE